MLNKKYRLKTNFDYIFKNGYRVRGHYGVLIFIPDANSEKSTFGIVVPKKVGKANKRNRIKRIVRFTIQQFINDGFFDKLSLNLVYISFKQPESFEVLSRELNFQLNGVLKEFKERVK